VSPRNSGGGGIGEIDATRLSTFLRCVGNEASERIEKFTEEVERQYHGFLAQRRLRAALERRTVIEDYLRNHPDATGNAVSRAIRGRRSDILQIVRELRSPVPASGNRHSEEQGDSGC
jgi:hypothetical protein